MSDALSFEQVRDYAKFLDAWSQIQPWAIEIRARDKATMIHVLNEPQIRRSDDRPPWDRPMGVPFFIDDDVPLGKVRAKLSDGTQRDYPPQVA